MDRVTNPFAPGAGTPPPALVGRQEIIEDASVTLDRIIAGRPEKSLLLIGLRGVGKTVLLNEIQYIAEKKGYKTVFIEALEDKKLPNLLLPHLRQLLYFLDRNERANEYVKRALRVLRAFVDSIKLKYQDIELTLDVEPETGTADNGDLESDLPPLLVAIAEAAKSRQTPIALIIDEMQYLDEEELSALIMSAHRISQKQLPLALIGAGLPQLVGKTGKSKSYAERLFNFPNIGPLMRADSDEALQAPVAEQGVAFTHDTLTEIFEITRGYPYFLQEWGYHTWNLANNSPIAKDIVQAAKSIVQVKLDEGFFRVRFDRLTPREKDYLRAAAELGPGPHKSGAIAEKLGIKVESAAPLRSGLIKKGMIYSPSHGDTAFTVPLFDKYMKRMMPTRKVQSRTKRDKK